MEEELQESPPITRFCRDQGTRPPSTMAVSGALFLWLGADVGSKLADSFYLPVGYAYSGGATIGAGKICSVQHRQRYPRSADSITQQILSRTRLLRIIDSLGLYAHERKRKTPDELVEIMRKDIEIELTHGDDKKLSAFNIYYANRDPKMAQAATAELANLFISENLEQRQKRSENTTSFLEDQLDQARAKLTAQEAKLRVFKDQHLGELPTQTQSNLQILTGLQSQVQANQDSLNRAKQQNTYLESLINQYRATDSGAKAGGEPGGAAGLAAIDKELDLLKSQLADLTSHYTDKHPDVRKTKSKSREPKRCASGSSLN